MRRRICDHMMPDGNSAFRARAAWTDTADRLWEERECRRCGLLRRFVEGVFWRRDGLRRKVAT